MERNGRAVDWRACPVINEIRVAWEPEPR
jgi:hypothetical protein